jgi:hypothetical protein
MRIIIAVILTWLLLASVGKANAQSRYYWAKTVNKSGVGKVNQCKAAWGLNRNCSAYPKTHLIKQSTLRRYANWKPAYKSKRKRI